MAAVHRVLGYWIPVVVGAWLIDPKTVKEWKRLYRLLSLRDQDEALVWIIAHEAFHYLRRTRQIDGKNVEIEADRYAEEVLRAFQALPAEVTFAVVIIGTEVGDCQVFIFPIKKYVARLVEVVKKYWSDNQEMLDKMNQIKKLQSA
jgi:hypothetical protein